MQIIKMKFYQNYSNGFKMIVYKTTFSFAISKTVGLKETKYSALDTNFMFCFLQFLFKIFFVLKNMQGAVLSM